MELVGRYDFKAGAMDIVVAMFDLGEIDVIVFDGDDVDFVEVGFVVFGDDSVAMLF